MPTSMDRTPVWLGLCALLALTGCGGDQPAQPATTQPPPAAKPDGGRPETRNLQAADAVGYDGAAVRRQVDTLLDQRDKQNRQLQQAAEGNPE